MICFELEHACWISSVIAWYEEFIKSTPPGLSQRVEFYRRTYRTSWKYGVMQLLGSPFCGAHEIASF